ncbi:MAG: hypothetical protein WD512_08550, partial [Candidatus Paceibacterota bacterium]
TSGIIPISRTGTIELPDYAYLPFPLSTLGGINAFSFYFSEGADTCIQAFYTFTPFDQYALQSISHGLYDRWRAPVSTEIQRFKIDDSFYIRDNIQQMRSYNLNNVLGLYQRYTINNLQRGDLAVIRTLSGPYVNNAFPNGVSTGPYYIAGPYQDQSLVTLSGLTGNSNTSTGNSTVSSQSISQPDWTDVDDTFSLPITSHYAALKYRIRNQYGQLDSVKQVVITTCEQKLSDYNIFSIPSWTCPTDGLSYNLQAVNTDTFFGGDVFINRYTEKNTMLYFYNWLYDFPNGFEYNYYLYSMVPRSRFWVNSKRFDVQDIASAINWSSPGIPGTGPTPTDYYRLDNERYEFANDSGSYPGFFR